jgi:PPOX class probable F420-dependent enzyme
VADHVGLADPAVRAFLEASQVVVLGTIEPDGSPLLTPMWFLPGGDALTLVSVAATRKVRNLRRDPRASVVADGREPGAVRGVALRGRVRWVTDPAEQAPAVAALLRRYPRLERLWGGAAMPPTRVLFRIVPDRVRSWGLG